jgi:cellulose synthase/poly-beta-1,6-N-acetylglucosamine synthase-like glycosyltransferase/peptidoglycan/xylan/chitin deacetylase (PgdA/CDA1 family)
VLGAHGLERAATALDSIPSGYDVEFDGEGEILKLAARPTVGLRTLHADSASGLIVDERLARYSTPYVVQRFGGDARGDAPKRIALTFDDGPDPRWTPQILDTLRSRGAKGTFFVIGQNVDAHIGLMRRVVSEGNEFGNHTYSHPNLALTSDFVTRLELSANQFLLEAIVGRRSALFRPPYFGDAEPTTADELVPVDIASRRGYLTVGLHIDAEDWAGLDAKTIVDTVLSQRERGNIVLLHDGGGGRAQTVAALGPLIDSLRARGDTIVLVSELAGLSPLQSMPPLPPESIATRALGLAGFWLLGAFEWVLYWAFFIAVILGLVRLLVITLLAAIQRVRARSEEVVDPDFRPVVSVIVPAFNEARVINATIASLLEQQYAGEIEIVVVDDGSKDGTAAVARERFGDHPRVTIFEKENGGKASALNFGIRRARGEIVIGLDADTVFMPNTVAKLVAPMRDEHVGAVAGNAKVGNRVNLVTRWQALEYVTSQNLDRRAFSLLNCITVVPGAVGAWRTSLVLKVGGFSDRTLAEDQDLTLAIRRLGYTIAYADEAIAYTEAPETLRALAKQRFRWAFGTLQCAWKYRPLLFRPRYGTLGFIALPNLWIFQLFFAAISPLADLMFVWSLLSVWLTWREHGDTYAATSLEHVLGYYAVFLIVDWFAAVSGFLMESDEERSLTWLIFIQRFAYRQIMYWVVVRSFVAAMRGGVVGWGKLERTGRMEAEGVGLRT